MYILRKLLQLPFYKTHVELMSFDIERIMKKCYEVMKLENIEQREAEESHNFICPKCKARKDNIVDKFRFVESKGGVEGKVNFGHGELKYNFIICTSEVNHCNKCGNEWCKYKTKDISKEEILKVALKYLAEVINDYENQRDYDWKLNTLKVFNGSYCETLRKLFKEHGKYVQKIPSRKSLNKYYKSLYDINEKELVNF